METAQSRSKLPTFEDRHTLHLLASGLVRLTRHVERGGAVTLPYVRELQLALDRLVLVGLLRSRQAPRSVPELIERCHAPLREWPLPEILAEDPARGAETLLYEGAPTDFCIAWAIDAADVLAELNETEVIYQAMAASADDPAKYVAFRTMAIEHPALTHMEHSEILADPQLRGLEECVTKAYEPAPVSAVLRGEFGFCGRCNDLLLVSHANEWVCESPRCRAEGPTTTRQRLRASDGALRLTPGMRRFVFWPGRVELRLRARLEDDLKLKVEMWPLRDRYDLRVTFPHGEVWAIDMKDQADPCLLARRVHEIPSEPRWDRGFFVFPDERRWQREDYLKAFENRWSPRQEGVCAVFEKDLVACARDALRRQR